MHPDWTLRVPVLRPRAADWFDAAAVMGVSAAVPLSLGLQGAPLGVALAAGAMVGSAQAIFFELRRGHAHAVSALRLGRDGAFELRMRQGWQSAECVARRTGPRWLTLRMRLPDGPAAGCASRWRRRSRHVSFTVWRDALPQPAWRRLCLLTSRRLSRIPASRTAGGS